MNFSMHFKKCYFPGKDLYPKRRAGDDNNKYSYCETVQAETISGNCQLMGPFGPGKRQNGGGTVAGQEQGVTGHNGVCKI